MNVYGVKRTARTEFAAIEITTAPWWAPLAEFWGDVVAPAFLVALSITILSYTFFR